MTDVRAYFVLTGFDCRPEVITNTLGIRPDETGKRRGGTGSYRITESYWEIRSDLTGSYAIEDYVADLVEKIRPFALELKNISEASDGSPEFNLVVVVAVTPDGPLPGMALTPNLMGFLSKYSINLVIDMN